MLANTLPGPSVVYKSLPGNWGGNMGRKIGGWIAWAAAFGVAFFVVKYGVSYVKGQEVGLTGAMRDGFVGGAIRTCGEKQMNDPANAGISKAILSMYCNCYANGIADRISENQLRAVSDLPAGQRVAAPQPVIDAVTPVCIDEAERAMPTAK